MQFSVIQMLSAVPYGALLYMISSGFSLVFGFMRITNMTHMVFYMIGAYSGFALYAATGSFTLAVIGAAVVTGIIGLIVFKFFLFKLQGRG